MWKIVIGQHVLGLLVDEEGSACFHVADAFPCLTLIVRCEVEKTDCHIRLWSKKK